MLDPRYVYRRRRCGWSGFPVTPSGSRNRPCGSAHGFRRNPHSDSRATRARSERTAIMKILLVDDSRVMRRYVARTLEMTGLEATIHEAGDGREGIATALAIRPDLVITDLNMPEMSGAELVAAMHASPELKEIPVL